MAKIVINLPYPDDEFNYGRLIGLLDEFLHENLDLGGWDYKIYRLDD